MESSYLIFNCNKNQSIQFYLHNIIVEYFNGKDTQQSQKYLHILLLDSIATGITTMFSAGYRKLACKVEEHKQIKDGIPDI